MSRRGGGNKKLLKNKKKIMKIMSVVCVEGVCGIVIVINT